MASRRVAEAPERNVRNVRVLDASAMTDKYEGCGADNAVVTSCHACGAGLPAAADWCGQCFARVAADVSFAPGAALPSEPVHWRTTRWGKTPTTFGPLGRVVATVGLLIPLAIMVGGGFAVMFSWGGAAVYAAVILPWGLRDIWQQGRVPQR